MKKVIGIYCGDMQYKDGKNWDSFVIRSEGAGGSETWAVEIASAFNKLGFHVIIFGNPDFWKFDDEGVEYIPFDLFEHRCQYQHFDYFISSRRSDEITTNLECHNVYYMSHEIGIFNGQWGNFSTYDELKMDRVKKIACLSEWHCNATLELYPKLKPEQIFLTINGINQSLYEGFDHNKKRNMMVWSTCLNRGLTFFGQYVYPKIKNVIPDFELNICSYELSIYGIIPEDKDIHFLGTLRKEELAELQKQAKVWCLPNYGLNDFGEPLHESFCITAVENGLAGNAIVCFNKDGLTTTLNGYKNILNADYFDEKVDSLTEEMKQRLSDDLANEIIHILSDDGYRIELSNSLIPICKRYTWKESAMTWLKEWGLIYE